jgi:hypothetical protein
LIRRKLQIHSFFSDSDNKAAAKSDGVEVESEEIQIGYDLTSPVSAFLERSRKQVERYFRRLTEPEPTQNGKDYNHLGH